MSKKLAIQGHSTRGKEIIELLEMMGGYADELIDNGINEKYAYLIIEDENNVIDAFPIDKKDEFDFDVQIFTLEEFLEKYPYKVGDKIPDVWGDSLTVKSMSWDENYKTVMYGFEESVFIVRADEMEAKNENKPLFKAGDVVKLKGCPDKNLFWIVMAVVKDGYIFNDGKKYSFDDQHHYEKSNREVINTKPSKMKNVLAELLEHIKTTPKEELEREFEEIKKWSNVGPTVEEFRTFCEYINKKPKYPATFEECLNMLYCKSVLRYIIGHKAELLLNLEKLLICRDAYWKIAGEEMGLGKPWEPEYVALEDNTYFTIQTFNGEIDRSATSHRNAILAFPTKEMRDAFYENFRDLIEQCKELL